MTRCKDPQGVIHIGHRWLWCRVYLRCTRCGVFRRRESKARVARRAEEQTA